MGDDNELKHGHPTTTIPPLLVTKNPDGNISGTKRAIIDPLVSKRPEKYEYEKKSENKKKSQKETSQKRKKYFLLILFF